MTVRPPDPKEGFRRARVSKARFAPYVSGMTEFAPPLRRASSSRARSICALILGGVLFAAPPAVPSAESLPAFNPQGPAGPYLAAEHAARRGDIPEAARLYARTLARDPENVRLMERTMLHQVAAGQIAQAVVVARKLERTEPGHRLGLLILAADRLKDEKYADIAEQLATGADSRDPLIYPIFEAWAAYDAEGLAAARVKLQDLETDEEAGPLGGILAAWHLGLMEAAEGNDEAAGTEFAKAEEALKGGGMRRLTRARVGALARSGRFEAAVALAREALNETSGDRRLAALAADLDRGVAPPPEIADPREGAADALYVMADVIDRGPGRLLALAYARLAVYLDPDLTGAQLLAGDILARNDRFGPAVEAYARIPEDAPEALEARIGSAEALRDDGESEEAIGVLREVVLRHPEAVEAHIALGDTLRHAHRFEEAAIAYDGAVALIDAPKRRHWSLFYQRGIAYERSGQWPKAEADFLKALELERDQPLVLNYLGYSWVEMRVNLERAQAMIERAVERRPNDGFIVDSLGWVFYRLGKYEEALAHMMRAVEIEPVDPTINDHYGDVLWRNGRRIEAEFQWRRALSFDPMEDDRAARIKRKLEIGLDRVLKEEAEARTPTLVETAPTEGDGG